MTAPQPIPRHTPGERTVFTATSWTAVFAAGHPDSAGAHEALNRLCEAYWGPLHAYIRGLGYSEDDAKDLTQEFFLSLLSKNSLRVADRRRGRFRSFLLATVNHFLSNQRDRARAAKRGGGRPLVSLDAPPAEDQAPLDPASGESPVKTYEREWARTLFHRAENALRQEYAAAAKSTLFDRLREFLETRAGAGESAAAAAELQMNPDALSVAVHRLRRRYGQLVRDEVAATLVNPSASEIEQERRRLYEIFSR
jgi:DNA-directed RNA polymerase specialized sigma24 family protein